MRKFLFLLLIPFSLHASPESACRRIQAHLLIGDPAQAISEAKKGLKKYPEHIPLYELALKSYGAAYDEGEMVALWREFAKAYPEQAHAQEVLEQMCWSILKKGLKAPGAASQLISIIGAALTQDMYAVPFLLEGLHHSNAHIRSVSVQLAALFGDHPLREKLVRMFQSEHDLEVRLEVIKAISKLQMDHLMPSLMARVSDPKIGAREKSVVIQALVKFRENLVTHEELTILAASKRAALRELACEVIAHCELKEEVALLNTFVEDTHPDVQAAALRALGLLRLAPTERIKQLAQRARHPLVGITAGWVWILAEPDCGEKALGHWLTHSNEEVQAIAASAVAAAGPYGVELARDYLEKTEDPYVQANLALALVGQRQGCEEACACLERFLHQVDEKWMFTEEGVFHTLQKSTVNHNPLIPNFPELINQKVRLELLNILAIMEYPGAEKAIRDFLARRQWGLTGLAAETLLGEGDETAIDHVRALLDDPEPEIKAEAALVLATWGRDPAALSPLLEVYPKADRQLQIKILESLGRIGNKDAIPFLIERLKEPSLMMRMIAATILIQTLNA